MLAKSAMEPPPVVMPSPFPKPQSPVSVQDAAALDLASSLLDLARSPEKRSPVLDPGAPAPAPAPIAFVGFHESTSSVVVPLAPALGCHNSAWTAAAPVQASASNSGGAAGKWPNARQQHRMTAVPMPYHRPPTQAHRVPAEAENPAPIYHLKTQVARAHISALGGQYIDSHVSAYVALAGNSPARAALVQGILSAARAREIELHCGGWTEKTVLERLKNTVQKQRRQARAASAIAANNNSNTNVIMIPMMQAPAAQVVMAHRL